MKKSITLRIYKEHLIAELVGFVRIHAIALDGKESWKRSVSDYFSDCKMWEKFPGIGEGKITDV